MREKYTFAAFKSTNLGKAFFLFVLFAGLAHQATAQLKLGNNPNTINASALLELESTDQGLLLPRLSQQQMTGIATPPAGLIVYNTDSGCAYVYNNNRWANLCGVNLADFIQFVTTSPGMDSIIRVIAEHASKQPLVDSIFHAVLVNAGNLSAASGLVTVNNGNKATLKNVTIDVNKDTLVNVVINSPLVHDSVISIIAHNSNQTPLRDSIFSTVVAQGKNVTGVTPILISGGTGASLRPVSVSIDSTRIVPLGGTPGQVLIRNGSGISIWGNVAGDNWGTQVISHDGTLQGNGTAGSPLGVDTDGLAVLLPVSPIRDTILNIVSNNGKNATGISPILISGGTGATLQPMSVSIDSNRIVPLGGTPGQVLIRNSFGVSIWGSAAGDNWGTQVISHDGTLQGNGTAGSPLGVDTAGLATLLPVSPIRDTIIDIINNNGKNATGISPILISGGAGATLQPMSVSIDSNRIVPLGGAIGQILTRDSFGTSSWTNTVGDNWGTQVISHDGTLQGNGTAGSPLGVDTAGLATLLPVSPIRDTIIDIINNNGKNVTGVSPILISGGTGAALQPVSVSIDSNRIIPLGGAIGQILTRDSFGTSSWTNTVGDNWGTQVISHDGTLQGNGTSGSPLGVDTAGLATLLPVSPIRDTIIDIINNNGKNVTGVSPILISGGAGAALQPVSVSIDSNRIIPLGGAIGQILTRDSFGTSSWTNTVGDNWGTQVISHDGTLQGNGTAGAPLGVDTDGLATLLPVSPIRDTIISIVTSNGKDLTAGSTLVTVTNGIGTTLKNTTVDVNKDTLVNVVVNNPLVHDSIIKIVADNSNKSPLRDSIFSTVVAQGKNLTSTSPAIIVNNGLGATLKNSSLYIDSAALIHLLIISHIQDSLMNFNGFNVAGTSSTNTFLSLSLGLGTPPDVVAAYEKQQLTTTGPAPQFNDFGVFNTGNPSFFTAPVTGYYSLTYTVSLVTNPSLVSAGGTITWGVALIKTNGTPIVLQSSRVSQTVSASVLGVAGLSTVGTNTVTALVKLTAGDTVSPGIGAVNGLVVGALSSNSTIQHFSGYWVK